MDAKELTVKFHEHEKQLSELRGRISVLEEKNNQLELKIKDLNYLEGYVNQINNRLHSLETQSVYSLDKLTSFGEKEPKDNE